MKKSFVFVFVFVLFIFGCSAEVGDSAVSSSSAVGGIAGEGGFGGNGGSPVEGGFGGFGGDGGMGGSSPCDQCAPNETCYNNICVRECNDGCESNEICCVTGIGHGHCIHEFANQANCVAVSETPCDMNNLCMSPPYKCCFKFGYCLLASMSNEYNHYCH